MNNDQATKELDKIRNDFLNKRSSLIEEKAEKQRAMLLEKRGVETAEKLLSTISEISEASKTIRANQGLTRKVSGSVSVENLPDVQKVKLEDKNVTVSNFPDLQTVKVSNLPDIQEVKVLNQKESTKIDNFPKIQDVRLVDQIDNLTIKSLPLAEGEEPSRRADPTKYLPVRLTNGRTFIEGFKNQSMTGGGSSGGIPFAKPDGTPARASVDNDGHVKVDVQAMPDVTISVGDIEIGAVEIKDHDSDVRANVGNNGLEVEVKASALPSGAATSANQQPPSTTPTVYNVTLINANTEYSQELPANTRELRFRCRTLYDVRYAWETGKVATPTAPYLTLPAGSDYWSDWNNLSSKTLYFASSTAGVVIELEVFTA